jgi:hypothetical protein
VRHELLLRKKCGHDPAIFPRRPRDVGPPLHVTGFNLGISRPQSHTFIHTAQRVSVDSQYVGILIQPFYCLITSCSCKSFKMANGSQPFFQISSPTAKAWSWSTYVVPSFLLYSVLCSLLRYQRRNAMCRKFGYTNRESFSKMTNVDAQAIITYLGQLEFPKIYTSSVQFALFKVPDPRVPDITVGPNAYNKTYGIPTICT